jgi:competence protein ComEA
MDTPRTAAAAPRTVLLCASAAHLAGESETRPIRWEKTMKLMLALLLTLLLVGGVTTNAAAEEPRLPPTHVNVNTADAETLALVLEGVGPAKAQAIVDYREANGGFEDVQDLLSVRGIGQRTLDANAERIRVRD